MLQKLIFLLITAILLTGCGASEPVESDAASVENGALSLCCDTRAVQAPPETIEDTEPCDVEYFRFETATNTISDESGVTLLYENQTLARFSSADPKRMDWVEGILENIRRTFAADSRNLTEYAAEFIDQNGTNYFYSYSNYQQLGIARHDETVVSMLSLSSLYSGGSHPNAVQTAYNLDITGQRLLRLEDVITEAGAGELAKLVRETVDEKFAVLGEGAGLFDDYAATIDTSMVYGTMTPYWYFNDRGLVIFYNQYELGPYAAGIIKAELPYDSLADILLEEYFPEEHSGSGGDLCISNDHSGLHSIPITIESDGKTLCIGVEDRIYQVQLSEILWLENTPIAQEILFSAKTLCQNDVLQITGGYDDESRSFAIEFVNGRGEQILYYIHDGELSMDP